ncbi:VWA domain-containing protein [Candidatus Pacearchaeota archaeon]|nr:VWA domain-containing protein [Candidatus Pacearchaeota archaeon]
MTDKNLKQTMGKEWQKVRKNFHYPQLPQPRLTDDVFGGSINMESLEIKINEPLIRSFEEYDISPEESLHEVLTHELTHFMKYPGSVLNILRLQKAGQGIADGKTISRLRTDYTEAQTRLDIMVGEKPNLGSFKMARACISQGAEPSPSGKIMWGLYQEISGQDLGIEYEKKSLEDKLEGVSGARLSDEESDLIDRLKDIDYLNKDEEIINFREFAQVLKDYQPPQNQNKKNEEGQDGEGKGQGQEQGSGQGNGLDGFSDNQIREGLKRFAQECSSPREYEGIVKQVLNEGKNPGQPSRAMGKRVGFGKGITQLADNFYTALAEKYAIPIRKKSMHKNGSLYPYSHTSFEIGDSITEVDAFSTPGILPGITKKWVKKEGEVYGDNEAVPDSFLIIDNSPSMFMLARKVIAPSKRIYQHIVGATATSNAYLLNGSRVAVYSFGSNDHLTNPTKNREIVHRELRRYSSDGGTTFNSGFLESVLKKSEREYDISVISDMEIGNLDGFIDSVLGIPQTHRVHLLYTENNNHVNQLRESFGNRENVAILPLTCERDIQKITMGELKKSVK